MMKSDARFNSIKAKVVRAEQHISALRGIDSNYRSIKCSLSIQENAGSESSSFIFNLPKPDLNVSAIVGDCLNNIRSSLDYLIWQIADSNKIAEASKFNMFPICTSEGAFNKQVKMNRLRGVPDSAIAIIRGLQPYECEGNHYLQMLSELCNLDKHRDLIYSVAIASDVELSFFSRGRSVFNLIVGNDEIRGGDSFGDIAIDPNTLSGKDTEVIGRANAVLCFRDQALDDDDVLPIVNTLEEMLDFVKHEVISLLLDNVVE